MQIANPLNDVAFKWLMLNKRIAKFLLGTLLGQNIVDLKPAQQEQVELYDGTPEDDKYKLAKAFRLSRLDYVATIVDKTGKESKIMVEVQKYYHKSDVSRFRKYLGNHYLNEPQPVAADGTLLPHLPLTILYILGYTDPEIPVCFTDGKIATIDRLTNQPIAFSSEFFSSLTHRALVLQIPRIPEKRVATKLGNLLTIFHNAHKQMVRSELMEYVYEEEITDEEVEYIIDELSKVAMKPEVRVAYEAEKEAVEAIYGTLAYYEKQTEKNEKTIEEQEKEIEEAKQAIELKEKIIAQNIMALEQKDKALEEKDKALEEKDRAAKELQISMARYMLSTGASVTAIMEATKLSKEELRSID